MQEMFDLFNPFPNELGKEKKADKAIVIPGLTYIGDFITEEEEAHLLKMIDKNEWLSDLKRRVQHYGWKYDYKRRGVDYSMFLGNLPDWIYTLAERLYTQGHTRDLADQVIINEYKPGQGIANHVDCEPCFGDSITSLSLGSTCVMNLINLDTKEKLEFVLEPRSALIIKDESRYKWSHGIPSRLADTINNRYVKRKLRISMTFRKILLK